MKTMKKLLALMLAFVMLCSLCACGNNGSKSASNVKEGKSNSSSEEQHDAPSYKDDDTSQKHEHSSQVANANFVGQWKSFLSVLTLYADGTGSLGEDYVHFDVQWEVIGNQFILTLSGYDIVETIHYEYTFSGDSLSLASEHGTLEVWTKQ